MNERERKVYAALAEAAVHASEEEIFDEAGEGAWVRAESIRQTLLEGVKSHEQRLLQQAFTNYREQVAKFHDRSPKLPVTADERRELLGRVFLRLSQTQQTPLTLQHRGFRNLSDDDVTSCLTQLEALGALEDDQGHDDAP